MMWGRALTALLVTSLTSATALATDAAEDADASNSVPSDSAQPATASQESVAAAREHFDVLCEEPDEKGLGGLLEDPKDGGFDASRYLGSAVGIMPVPIIITEPALDGGIGLAVLYFHDSIKDLNFCNAKPEDRLLPPNISGVFGGYTFNGSWFAGGFHFGNWFQDHLRYFGTGSYADVNLTFYGSGSLELPQGLIFNNKNIRTTHQLKGRIPKTSLFVGASYELAYSDIVFELPPPLDQVEAPRFDTLESGIGVVATWDERDNVMTPNRGYQLDGEVQFFGDAIGGNHNFTRGRVEGQGFIPVLDPLVVGLRADGWFSDGDTPFFMKPFIDLRSIPIMRYQGQHAILAETEARLRIWRRWSVVGFFGVGKAFNGGDEFSDVDWRPAGGLGFRYLLARLFRLHAGVDIARGPEDWAGYLTIGNAW